MKSELSSLGVAPVVDDVDANQSGNELARIAAQTAAAIVACERDLKLLQGRLATLRRVQQVLAENDDRAAKGNTDSKERRRRSPGGSTSEAVRQVVAGALRLAGRPMKRGELLDHVLAAGIDLGGARPERKLSKILSMSKSTFQNAGDGYWFAGEPMPSLR